MIGFYNYSVILTYVGLTSAIVGMTQIFSGNDKVAVLCLIISGICDMFDGNIARRMKNRTEQEKVFGIQIDSLCDLICFGMFPAVFCYFISANKLLGGAAAAVLVLSAVIRLAYFNVKEQERQQKTEDKRECYQGLPVTSMSMIIPGLYCFRHLLGDMYGYILPVSYFLISFLFLYDFKFTKPGKKGCSAMVLYGVAVIIGTLLS